MMLMISIMMIVMIMMMNIIHLALSTTTCPRNCVLGSPTVFSCRIVFNVVFDRCHDGRYWWYLGQLGPQVSIAIYCLMCSVLWRLKERDPYKSQNILVDQKNCCGTLVVDLAWCTERYNYRNDITQCWKIADLKLAKILEKEKIPTTLRSTVFSDFSTIIINNNITIINITIINNNNNNNIISPWEALVRLPLSWGGGLGWLSTDE